MMIPATIRLKPEETPNPGILILKEAKAE